MTLPIFGPNELAPGEVREPELVNGRSITVTRNNGDQHVILYDDSDADVVEAHRWCVTTNGNTEILYATTAWRRADGRKTTMLMHRLLLGVPDVDHANHNGLDNRRGNLRVATRSQQLANQRPIRGGTSCYKGVSRSRGQWRAVIRPDGKQKFLGRFSTEEEAARVHDAAALAQWGEFAYLNFPQEKS